MSFNDRAIKAFGEENVDMPRSSPSRYNTASRGELLSYLDFQLVKAWAHRYLRSDPLILDAGAGKGRMTRYFAEIGRCIAVEPYVPFFEQLKSLCEQVEHTEAVNCTLQEYLSSTGVKFDLIYLSGVTMYLDDEELTSLLKAMRHRLAPCGAVCIRDRSSLSTTEYSATMITRTREHVVGLGHSAGLKLIRLQRAYPPFVFERIAEIWPSRLTNSVANVSEKKAFWPIWEMVRRMNIKPANSRYHHFYYLFT